MARVLRFAQPEQTAAANLYAFGKRRLNGLHPAGPALGRANSGIKITGCFKVVVQPIYTGLF